MTTVQIIVLALVQGLTEFLPVSSAAHLILASHLTAWQDQGLAFDAATHIGTLGAVLLYFRHDLARMATGLKADAPDGDRRLLGTVMLATIPALAAGALTAALISTHLRSPLLIATTTLFFALVLLAADRLGRQQLEMDSVGWRQALLIGLAQVLALVPGTSRSGITISAGLALGLTREAAARFSFLLSIPIIAAAGGWGFVQALRTGEVLGLAQFVAGATLAGVVAWITIDLFLRWLKHYGMTPFVIYRLLLGITLLILFWPDGA